VAGETVVVEADAFKETDIIYQTLQSMDDVAGTSELVCGVSVSSDRSQFESDLLVQEDTNLQDLDRASPCKIGVVTRPGLSEPFL
jgi:hypothetical protein